MRQIQAGQLRGFPIAGRKHPCVSRRYDVPVSAAEAGIEPPRRHPVAIPHDAIGQRLKAVATRARRVLQYVPVKHSAQCHRRKPFADMHGSRLDIRIDSATRKVGKRCYVSHRILGKHFLRQDKDTVISKQVHVMPYRPVETQEFRAQ
jgi:hypothetical protein